MGTTHDVDTLSAVDEERETAGGALRKLGEDLLGVRTRVLASVRRRRVREGVVERCVNDTVLRRRSAEREDRDVRLQVVVDLCQ